MITRWLATAFSVASVLARTKPDNLVVMVQRDTVHDLQVVEGTTIGVFPLLPILFALKQIERLERTERFGMLLA